MKKRFLTLDEIRAAGTKLRKIEVLIPEWDTLVYVCELNARDGLEINRLQEARKAAGGNENDPETTAMALSFGVKTKDGERIDGDLLLTLSASSIGKLSKAFADLNNVSETKAAALEKNSGPREDANNSD